VLSTSDIGFGILCTPGMCAVGSCAGKPLIVTTTPSMPNCSGTRAHPFELLPTPSPLGDGNGDGGWLGLATNARMAGEEMEIACTSSHTNAGVVC